MTVKYKLNGEIVEKDLFEVPVDVLEKIISKSSKKQCMDTLKHIVKVVGDKSDEELFDIYKKVKDEMLDDIVLKVIKYRKLFDANIVDKMILYNQIDLQEVKDLIIKIIQVIR